MYSQNAEEKAIVDYFKGKVGTVLDIGAFNGKVFSNSLRLIELGWTGACVEPSPAPFAELKELHKDRPQIQCINAAVGTKDGMIDFYDTNGDAVSSTDLAHKAKWEKGSKIKFQAIKVQSVTPATLLAQTGYHFDFVNIDTESTNLEVLKGLVLAGLRFELLCIEHDNQHPAIVAMFPGCQPIYQNAENLIIYFKMWK